MITINITNARQNLFQLVSDVDVDFNPITIVNNINEIRKNENCETAPEYNENEKL